MNTWLELPLSSKTRWSWVCLEALHQMAMVYKRQDSRSYSRYAYIVSPVILSSISAVLISYPQSTSCLIGTSLWSVYWKGKKFKCGLLGFCAMCWCWLNWTAEALQYSPCWRWPRRALREGNPSNSKIYKQCIWLFTLLGKRKGQGYKSRGINNSG